MHRQITDNWIWKEKPFSYGQAWIHLLLSANHADNEIVFDGKIIVVERGSFVTSIYKLSEVFGWDRKKTTRFLNLLERQKMVSTNRTARGTTITIEKYSVFQECVTTEGTTMGTTVATTKGPQVDTNKNENNEKKERTNLYSFSFESLWKEYPRKIGKAEAYKCYQARLRDGYSEEELLQATKRYAKECQSEDREQKYIKHAKTFLGPNTPFVDYIKKESCKIESENNRNEHGVEDREPASNYYSRYL